MEQTPDPENQEFQQAYFPDEEYREVEPGFESAESVEGAENLEPLPSFEELPAPTRIDLLTEAIERYPEAASNYVIRGEALLDEGQYEWAAHDFTTALQLAEAQAQAANWEYIYRALYDRAQEGLRRAQALNRTS